MPPATHRVNSLKPKRLRMLRHARKVKKCAFERATLTQRLEEAVDQRAEL